ncbi:hypothetical protein GLOIN_2v1844033 [Rhizophagus clarus]|uniref:Uncharacterized protein n=1 Tax=Rhizophagus clarus TaxID=94130 RepID=A0A8H3QBQ9_9GLOM|nr:hypothetical protein GLOIN_2v1844033 [Rhizophagus clarus]
MPIVGTLCDKEDEFPGRDELSRQVDIPCQNASHLDQQNQYDGIESAKPPINSEFDDFGERRGDYMNHVWGISSQWGTFVKDINQQPGYSDGECRINTCTQMVLSESSKRIQSLSSQLGPFLQVNTPEGNARAKKKPCHFVLPMNQPKTWSNKNDASLCQVFLSDEIDEEHEYSNNLPILIDTIMKPNRCYIANSLGYGIHDKDQEDYISYIKKELIGYIEEVIDYGFDHIIIIGELDYGILFLDCFGRVFNLDSMTSALLFHGDYFKGVERVTKGLGLKWVPWIVESDGGNIVEVEIDDEKNERNTNEREKKEELKKEAFKKEASLI